MFHRVKKDKAAIVSTKEELKEAIDRKESCIEIQGELAKKLQWIEKLSKAKRRMLLPVLESSKVSSAAIAQPAIAAITGAEIAIIILSTGVALTLIIAILRDYDSDITIENGRTKIILRRKAKSVTE